MWGKHAAAALWVRGKLQGRSWGKPNLGLALRPGTKRLRFSAHHLFVAWGAGPASQSHARGLALQCKALSTQSFLWCDQLTSQLITPCTGGNCASKLCLEQQRTFKGFFKIPGRDCGPIHFLFCRPRRIAAATSEPLKNCITKNSQDERDYAPSEGAVFYNVCIPHANHPNSPICVPTPHPPPFIPRLSMQPF